MEAEISIKDITEKIKAEALSLGFSVCGVARAGLVPDEVCRHYDEWLEKNYHGSMSYLERNKELRRDPRKLVEGTRSIIMVAMNYYPKVKREENTPKIAYYAYGRDYHKVVKKRLDKLLKFVQEHIDEKAEGRSFADSAPIMERYWAVQAGLGWIGKNGLLIIPKLGSFFVLGVLMINLDLEPDEEMPNKCGVCERCIKSCPTNALLGGGLMDARRCVSYLTIESKDEIPKELAEKLGDRLYGCDTCQEVCPWNRLARPTEIEDFHPKDFLLELDYDTIEAMEQEEYNQLFAGSPIRRAGLDGLKRSLRAIKKK